MINFSFIIPHKNTPDMLRRCLDSIPHRDDVEIIVVDDNSDADHVDFSNFPGEGEKNTRIIYDKVSGGCAHAVNIAMDNAIGKWIVRGDADDFFNSGIEEAMDTYGNSTFDIIYFKGNSINLPDGTPGFRADVNNMAVEKAISESDYRYVFSNSCPWCKFYNRDFLNRHGLRLHEVRWSTEVTFCAKIARLAESYEASPLNIYCVTDSPNTMVKNTSLTCRICRFNEDAAAVSILRPIVGHFEFIHYWMFRTWFNVYKTSKIASLRILPKALLIGRTDFIRQMIKALR